MITSIKVRLEPNNKQNTKLFQASGTARFIYNWTLAKQEENYKNGGKFITDNDLRKELTQLKKTEQYQWLNSISNNVAKQAVKDGCESYKKFFKKLADKPKFKSRKKCKPSFYHDTDKIKFTETHVQLEKKLRKLQRKVSNKYDKNKKGGSYVKTSNIIKLEKNIRKLHRNLDNIRTDYRHKVTTEIVRTKPSRIVMESLNVKGMMKNKHLSKAVSQQGFFQFKTILKYKAERYGIEFVEADIWYPSSKTCSECGNIKTDLSLSERTFVCGSCGAAIDRDKNASINLSRYKVS